MTLPRQQLQKLDLPGFPCLVSHTATVSLYLIPYLDHAEVHRRRDGVEVVSVLDKANIVRLLLAAEIDIAAPPA